jgi:hypothetical protein
LRSGAEKANDDEAVVRLRELIVAGKGGQEGNGNAKTNADNVSIRSDLFTAPESRKKKADAGNSRAYTLCRLKNERPDLFEKVVSQLTHWWDDVVFEQFPSWEEIKAGENARLNVEDSYLHVFFGGEGDEGGRNYAQCVQYGIGRRVIAKMLEGTELAELVRQPSFRRTQKTPR